MLESTSVNLKAKPLFLFLAIALIGILFYMFNKEQAGVSRSISTSETPSGESTLGETFTIIAFGDSLTAGYGVPLEESYPALLEKELLRQGKDVRIINMGVSGETTTGGLDRVNFIISQEPKLVLLALGANDMLRASSPSAAKENIRKIIERLQQEEIGVVLLGMKSTASNGREYREEFDSIYASLAKEYNIPLVPFFLEGVALNPNLNTADGIHPNKSGYEKIIKENILPVLLPVLKSKGI